MFYLKKLQYVRLHKGLHDHYLSPGEGGGGSGGFCVCVIINFPDPQAL